MLSHILSLQSFLHSQSWSVRMHLLHHLQAPTQSASILILPQLFLETRARMLPTSAYTDRAVIESRTVERRDGFMFPMRKTVKETVRMKWNYEVTVECCQV